MYCPACGHDKNPPGADQCGNCGLALTQLDALAPQGPVEAGLTGEPISVLDPRPPITVPVEATIGDAIRLMISARTGAVLVTSESGELAGILTERDFMTKIAGEPGFETLPVSRFMTPNPETVAPTDMLAYALSKMDAGGYRHLPVVQEGKPVGVVSVRDILRLLTTVCPDG